MALTLSDDSSDEEIFFGKLTLKEVKKHLMWPDNKRNPKLRYNEPRIIETHSEPDLNKNESINLHMNIESTSLSSNGPSHSNWDINPNGDSFLEIENMVTDLCDKKETVNGLDNTIDIIDYIKKKRPNKCVESTSLSKSEHVELENTITDQDKSIILITETDSPQSAKYYTPENPKFNSHRKTEDNSISPFTLENENFKTPMSDNVELGNTTTDQDKSIILITEIDSPLLAKYYTPEKPRFDSHRKTEDNSISPFTLENENFKTPMSDNVELGNTTTDQDKSIILITETESPQFTKYYTAEKPKLNSGRNAEDNSISPFTLENENFKTRMSKNVELGNTATDQNNSIILLIDSPQSATAEKPTSTPSPQKTEDNSIAPLRSEKKLLKTSLKKTPYKRNKYEHIASPVSYYIKNCPVTPLYKVVRPTRPLPGKSYIPKLVKLPPTGKSDCKENINLPSVCYKSAKKIRVIEKPDEKKIPPTQWLKKITSSIPKPVILKHNAREFNVVEKKIDTNQEHSFADLSLQQADLSICTQTSAFNKP